MSSPVPAVDLFGIRIDNVTMEEAIEAIRGFLRGTRGHYVVTPNVDHVVRLQKDAGFRELYRGASLVTADGMPLVWASRLLGRPIRERVTGMDLVPKVCALAAEEGAPVFFLGGNPGVAEQAAVNLRKSYPGLQVAGAYGPPFGFEKDPGENRKAVERVKESGAAVLFVALGSPKQERWAARHMSETGIRLALCIGSALDYPAGMARRAPRWMRDGGLEWLWRLTLEPGRLAKRYFIDDFPFFALVLREWLAGRPGERLR